MISLIQGTVVSKEKNVLVVSTNGGVGYAIAVSPLVANELFEGAEVTLHTYLKVSDSAMDLYGFRSLEERSFFSLLLSVSGVGPKSAMNILSVGSIEEIESAISRGDATYLSAVQGIGKKTAERMVVELKSKVAARAVQSGDDQVGDVLKDVIDGLVAMGYSKDDARLAATACDPAGKSLEQLLREALQSLAT